MLKVIAVLMTLGQFNIFLNKEIWLNIYVYVTDTYPLLTIVPPDTSLCLLILSRQAFLTIEHITDEPESEKSLNSTSTLPTAHKNSSSS